MFYAMVPNSGSLIKMNNLAITSQKHAYIILSPPPPPKPDFYIVKLGFTGIYIIFSYFFSKTRTQAVLTSTHNLCFEQEYEKCHILFIWKFSFFGCKIFNIFK